MTTSTKTPPKTTTASAKAKTHDSSASAAVAHRGNQVFLFDRTNYMWMLAGLALILIGIALTAGGKSVDPHKFNYDEIYSFRRITLAPIMIMIGFGLEFFAIMRKPEEEPATI